MANRVGDIVENKEVAAKWLSPTRAVKSTHATVCLSESAQTTGAYAIECHPVAVDGYPKERGSTWTVEVVGTGRRTNTDDLDGDGFRTLCA